MSDYVYLHGSEDVLRAGHAMASAAEEMSRAAAQIAESVSQYQRISEEMSVQLAAATESVERLTASFRAMEDGDGV